MLVGSVDHSLAVAYISSCLLYKSDRFLNQVVAWIIDCISVIGYAYIIILGRLLVEQWLPILFCASSQRIQLEALDRSVITRFEWMVCPGLLLHRVHQWKLRSLSCLWCCFIRLASCLRCFDPGFSVEHIRNVESVLSILAGTDEHLLSMNTLNLRLLFIDVFY